MARRAHRYERSVQEPQWAIRIATVVILAIGVAITIYALGRPEARRERATGGLSVGDTSASVVASLGQPRLVCRATDLSHLHGRFPVGWPAAAQEQAIDWLEENTAARWLYPLRARAEVTCQGLREGTEVGLGADDRVLWLVPMVGRQSLRLPDELEPGTFTEQPDA
jgi:hypothetical protein